MKSKKHNKAKQANIVPELEKQESIETTELNAESESRETVVESAVDQTVENSSNEPELTEKLIELPEAEYQELVAQIAELKDQHLRQIAEFENFRRRSRQEKSKAYEDAVCDAIREILPIVDNIERALRSADKIESDEAKAVIEGLELIKQQADQTLEKLGVQEVAGKGEPFNPEEHNAVLHVEDQELEANTIKEVLEKGYRKGERVIRTSQVMVAN